jgi:hypothetical protein
MSKAIHRCHQQLALAIDRSSKGMPAIIPHAGARLWRIFLDLHGTRRFTQAGPQPIPFAEIDAYARLMREEIRPIDLAGLRAMDAAYLKAARERDQQPAPVQGERAPLPRRSSLSLSPKLFDAMFS